MEELEATYERDFRGEGRKPPKVGPDSGVVGGSPLHGVRGTVLVYSTEVGILPHLPPMRGSALHPLPNTTWAQGVLNWVAQPKPGVEPPSFEARLYDTLFTTQSPGGSETWLEELNPNSLAVVHGALATPALAAARVGDRCESLHAGCAGMRCRLAGAAWIAALHPSVEPALIPGDLKCHCRFQLERLGYFTVDPDSRDDAMVLNRTCALKDSFAK